LTSAGVGHRLALLIDGAVVCSPRIEAPISAGQIMCGHQLTERQADALAARIKRHTS
jgi:preprotein translocase subunit SecD